jgi:hypothetical protein
LLVDGTWRCPNRCPSQRPRRRASAPGDVQRTRPPERRHIGRASKRPWRRNGSRTAQRRHLPCATGRVRGARGSAQARRLERSPSSASSRIRSICSGSESRRAPILCSAQCARHVEGLSRAKATGPRRGPSLGARRCSGVRLAVGGADLPSFGRRSARGRRSPPRRPSLVRTAMASEGHVPRSTTFSDPAGQHPASLDLIAETFAVL